QMYFEMTGLQYSPKISFVSKKEDVNRALQKENEVLPGINIGYAREMRIGKGFSWSFKLGGFYNKGWDEQVDIASADLDVAVKNLKKDMSVYGGETMVSLNYQFNAFGLTMQPFLQAGFGRALSKTNVSYEYELSTLIENYKDTIDEDINFAKFGLGLNFISNSGIYSYIALHQHNFEVINRKTDGTALSSTNVSSPGSATATKTDNAVSEASKYYAFTLGFGYRF
ncbi:MAG: hypothetical protein ACI9QD_001258, partial [Thermoproteota archaeon]